MQITRNPTGLDDTHAGRSATYYGGTGMVTWYWRRLEHDPPGFDGFRIVHRTTGPMVLGVRHVSNEYYAEDPLP